MLQLCVVWRWLWPWFRQLKHVIVPFKVENDDVMSVYYRTQQMPYDMSRGPLWRARLVPLPQSSSGHHEAVLIINAHHCITDGLTNMVICRDTLEVLNATIIGKPHPMPIRPVIPALADSLVTWKDWFYIFTYFWSKLYASLITNYNKKLYFNGALPQPATKLAMTKVLRQDFSVETTKKLLRRCKEARVTVHSCIVAAGNLAMLKLAQERSPGKLESAKINSVNCINNRRYYPSTHKESLGCHISLEEREMLIQDCDASSQASFWLLARRTHDSLLKSLNVDRNPIRNGPLFQPSILMLYINYTLTRRGCKNRTDNHFITTNMGDLRELLPAKYGDECPVEITNILRSVTSELTGSPYTLVFHTFEGRFMISLDYFTNKVVEDVALQFFSIITEYIDNIANYGNVVQT